MQRFATRREARSSGGPHNFVRANTSQHKLAPTLARKRISFATHAAPFRIRFGRHETSMPGGEWVGKVVLGQT